MSRGPKSARTRAPTRASAQPLAPGALARVANTPLLVTPKTARAFMSYLIDRRAQDVQFVGPAAFDDDEAGPSGPTSSADLRYRRNGKTFHIAGGGIAVIPVDGTLVHKNGTLDTYCGLTGYDGLERKLNDALADPEVRGVLFDFNSPGGEVAGCDGLAQAIRAARDKKPVWAAVDEMAYSAAFWLAAACSRVYLTPTAGVGSVGVVWMHVDYSDLLKQEGIAVTLVHAGAHKVDGNPYEPLPKDVRAEMERECDDIRTRFATAVAQGRGISFETVMATEARCLTAVEALDIGFVDGIVAAAAIVPMFLDDLNGAKTAPRYQAQAVRVSPAPAASSQPQMEDTMSDKTGATAPTPTATAPSPAPAPATDLVAQATAAAKQRFAAILALPEAKGREASAQKFAAETDMSVDQVKAFLAALPAATAKPAETPLQAAMAGVAQPELGAAAPATKPAGTSTVKAEDLDPTAIHERYMAQERPRRAV
ncbi:MAG: S49 family peptidase [Rhodospirillaceae bacterium]|nr:S49 family peptidase [Rhodospirillaceae bacterium]